MLKVMGLSQGDTGGGMVHQSPIKGSQIQTLQAYKCSIDHHHHFSSQKAFSPHEASTTSHNLSGSSSPSLWCSGQQQIWAPGHNVAAANKVLQQENGLCPSDEHQLHQGASSSGKNLTTTVTDDVPLASTHRPKTPLVDMNSPHLRRSDQVNPPPSPISYRPRHWCEIEERSTESCPKVITLDSKFSKIDIVVNIFPLHTGTGNGHRISFQPTEYSVRRSCLRKVLSWNCCGAGDPKIIRNLKDLCERHQPSIAFLFETMIAGTDAGHVIKDLGFSGSYCVDPVGFTGGFCLLWHKEEANITISSTDPHQIHADVQILPEVQTDTDSQDWVLCGYESDQSLLP